jgi:toxin ParE1/3/4
VKLLILPSADNDIVRQFEWYVEQDVPEIARRFRQSLQSSFEAVLSRPQAGAPRSVRNSALHGLRAWSVNGFGEFHIYYVLRQEVVMIVRVLHDKRDVDAILDKQSIDDPGTN